MDVSGFVAMLSKVRRNGDGYIAACPAHKDKSPSLAVKGLSDGRILLHCFAGCDTESVLSSLGLKFSDVMPENLGDFRRVRRAFTAEEALKALSLEGGIMALVAADIADGKPISPTDADRCALAVGRITSALEFVHGG